MRACVCVCVRAYACACARHGRCGGGARRVRLAGGDDKVVGGRLLQHHPHHLDVVARVAPVALGVDVAHVERLLQALVDPSDRTRHLRARPRKWCRGASARHRIDGEELTGRRGGSGRDGWMASSWGRVRQLRECGLITVSE
eukprot:3828899-Pleurochrysis_carterae.AAC.1